MDVRRDFLFDEDQRREFGFQKRREFFGNSDSIEIRSAIDDAPES